MTVTERIDGLPLSDTIHEIRREEHLLFDLPDPGPMKLWEIYPPLGVINMPMVHEKEKFGPPRGIFENNQVHVEWQKLNGRQPFYHRNTDCDEIAFHVSGQRSVITEFGTVDLNVGDFSMIPVGVGHDNRAIDDVHLIFYIPAHVAECKAPARTSEYRSVPFEGWEPPNKTIEFVTEHLGTVGSDSSVFHIDEELFLAHAKDATSRLHVLRPEGGQALEWLYKGSAVWLGWATTSEGEGEKIYTRHRVAHEVQMQIGGHRTLFTQRGTVELGPGDFICVPKGAAFRSSATGDEKSTHIVILTTELPVAKQPFTKYSTESHIKRST